MTKNQIFIRYLIQPENFPNTVTFSNTASFGDVINRICLDLNKSSDQLRVSFNDHNIKTNFTSKGKSKEATLNEIGCQNQKTYDLLVNFDEHRIESKETPKEAHPLVKRVKSKSTKPRVFLGGYRHKKTGVLYLNHGAQCTKKNLLEELGLPAELVNDPKPKQFCRDSQTYETITRSCQSNYSKASQIKPRQRDIYDENKVLKVVKPKKYVPFQKILELHVKACLRVQCFYRKLQAKRLLRNRRNQLKSTELRKQKTGKEEKIREYNRRLDVQQRKQHPKSLEDFSFIREDVRQWKENLSSNVTSNAEKKKLIDVESSLIREMSSTQRLLKHKQKMIRKKKKLEELSQDKQWGEVFVETPATRRAKEVEKFYQVLRNDGCRKEEETEYSFQKRWLEDLIKVKWFVKNFKFKKSAPSSTSSKYKRRFSLGNDDEKLRKELLKLLDREATLHTKGRKPRRREQLRERMCSLFYDLAISETQDRITCS